MQNHANISDFLSQQGYADIELRPTPVGHLELDVSVDGHPARMLVDTGAGATVIDRAAAQRWVVEGTATEQRAFAGCQGDIGTIDDATVGALELGGVELTDVAVKLMDLAQINDALERAESHRIDGILGADVMVSREAVIEYAGRRLHLRRSVD